MTAIRLKIDIWSDVMCPWCLIGWGNLRQALDRLEGEIAADVHWHAFELNPGMPNEGRRTGRHISLANMAARWSNRAVCRIRWRSRRKRRACPSITKAKSPAPPAMIWNTFDAHKLLVWAGEAYGGNRQTALKLALFEAHFNERMRIGERNVLLDVAEATGFDRSAAEAVLDSDEYATKVRAEEQAAFDLNVTGVPAMIVEDRFMIPGAQSPDVYVNALRRVAGKVFEEARKR